MKREELIKIAASKQRAPQWYLVCENAEGGMDYDVRHTNFDDWSDVVPGEGESIRAWSRTADVGDVHAYPRGLIVRVSSDRIDGE